MVQEDSEQYDRDIIRRVLGKDINAFEFLVQKYERYVLSIVARHASREAVEEIAHDVFVRAYTSLSTFSFRGSFKNWLAGITVRCCFDYWRKRYRHPEIPNSALTDDQLKWVEAVILDQSDQDFQHLESQQEAREVLDRILGKLTPKDRMVVTLLHFEGRTAKEVAAHLGWSAMNVKVRDHRARRKLRQLIAELLSRGG